MPPSSRPTVNKAAAAKAAAAQKSSIPAPSPWAEYRLVSALLFGLLAICLCQSKFLDEDELTTFTAFLRGPLAWHSALGSPLFWKMFAAFVFGGAAGYVLSQEIPRVFAARANKAARFLALILITLVVYIPAMSAGFIWDDDQEIYANTSLRDTKGLVEIWTGAKSADYFPLKTTLLWVEYQLWGHDAQFHDIPYAYHVSNILVHVVDVLLLWLVLSQLRIPGAWLASLLFAVHPVHVESVAWIAEHKNTLSLLFFLLSINAWVKFEDTGKQKHYNWALVHFLAALLCKTHVVVLPAVLLLLTWWRSGNLTKRDFKRSIPFFALAFLLGVVTVYFQNGRAIGQEVIPIGGPMSRIAGAGLAIWWYFEKAFLPFDLNTIYDRWPIKEPLGPQPIQFLAGAMAIVTLVALGVFYFRNAGRNRLEQVRGLVIGYFAVMALSALAFFFAGPSWIHFVGVALLLAMGFTALSLYLLNGEQDRLGRTPFFVFAYFLGTLFPVLGLFKMSYMRLTLQADHFQYLSDVAIVAVVAALICKGLESAGRLRPVVVAATVLLVFGCSAYSWQRAAVHQSEKTLWTACLAKNDGSWQAHNHLGAVIYMEGKVSEAQVHFQRAVDLKPENPEVHNNLGLAFAAFGHFDTALEQYRLAVQIKGDVPAMRRNLADCLSTLKKFDEAAEQFKIVLAADSNDPNALSSYGYVLSQLGRLEEAQKAFEKAYQIDPNNPRIKQNLDAIKHMRGQK